MTTLQAGDITYGYWYQDTGGYWHFQPAGVGGAGPINYPYNTGNPTIYCNKCQGWYFTSHNHCPACGRLINHCPDCDR